MTRLILIALCIFTFSLPAFAQSEMMTYDPTHTGSGNRAAQDMHDQQQQSLKDQGFIRPDVVQLNLVHYPYMNDDQFGIQMTVPDMISGCYTFTPLEYEAKFVDPNFLDIKVKQYRRVAPESVNTKCSRQNKMASALMVLDKKDLQSRGTQEIRFSTEVATDKYRIILDDTRLELVPESMVIFQGQNMTGSLKDRLVHTFSNDKTVVLQVPMARPDEDLTPQMISFGRSLGLSPAQGEFTEWDGNNHAIYYFTDRSGQTAGRIGEDGFAEIGTVKANRPYDGQDGRTETAVDLSVFVTRPGTQL